MGKTVLKVDFNAPTVLTFSLLALFIMVLESPFNGSLGRNIFSVPGTFIASNPMHYLRLLTHVLGHASFQHLFGNLFLILLLGPILEEKYGSKRLLYIILITAVTTGVIHTLFYSSNLLGASGVVFSFIVLASIVNLKQKSIPLTFILVTVIFIGNEIFRSFQPDQISQMAHIIGGICGAVAGFKLGK